MYSPEVQVCAWLRTGPRIACRSGLGTQGHRTYAYDSVLRLKRAQLGGVTPAATHEYNYDAFGNRTGYGLNGQWTSIGVSPTTNRLTNASYDASGNQTAQLATAAAYDGFNMATSYRFDASNVQTFVYTPSDERIGVLRGTDWTWSLRGGDGRVLRQYRSSSTSPGSPWHWIEDFVYRDGLLLGSERAASQGGRRHYHLDHLGTPRLVTGANGSVLSEHDLLPFGEERTAIGQHQARGYDREEPLRFTGHERDFDNAQPNDSSSYVDSMHARYYATKGGRFLSVDPVLDVRRALKSPQMWNRYSYVVNNPINRIDPDGRLVQLVGTDEERKKALDLIKAKLREQDRQYVTMNKNGVVSVDAKAKGGLGLYMLRDLARKDKPTVNVSLGLTATAKTAPGPSPTFVIDLQTTAGGGVTLRPWQAMSGTYEVHVDPRGNLQFGASPGLVMAHELLGHAWDLMFKGTSSERSAVTTETNLLLQLGLPQFRPVPTDEERP